MRKLDSLEEIAKGILEGRKLRAKMVVNKIMKGPGKTRVYVLMYKDMTATIYAVKAAGAFHRSEPNYVWLYKLDNGMSGHGGETKDDAKRAAMAVMDTL